MTGVQTCALPISDEGYLFLFRQRRPFLFRHHRRSLTRRQGMDASAGVRLRNLIHPVVEPFVCISQQRSTSVMVQNNSFNGRKRDEGLTKGEVGETQPQTLQEGVVEDRA